MAYQHTNSKGKTYTLYTKTVSLRKGVDQPIYYFLDNSRKNPPTGTPCDLPETKEVWENPRTNMLTVVRKKSLGER